MPEDIWSREARLERLEDALEGLEEASRDGTPILVEGEKDEAALRALGVHGLVVRINAGRPLFAFFEDLGRRHRRAILLVDWDLAGGKLARRIRESCAANSIALDEAHRKALSMAVGGAVKTVESLDTYLATLRKPASPRHEGSGGISLSEG